MGSSALQAAFFFFFLFFLNLLIVIELLIFLEHVWWALGEAEMPDWLPIFTCAHKIARGLT